MSKRTTTKVAGGRNGGIHDVRQYKAACKWLETHTFTNGQLWHLVFFGSNDRKDYEAGLDRLCERLRDKGMRVEWRAAFEYDPEKLDPERRFHRHVFLLIEASDKKPIGTINYKTDKSGLFALLARHNLKFYICKPGDDLGIHGGQPYMYVPKKPGVKLGDCTSWIEYIYKTRSKAGVVGRIYSSSRNKTAKPAPQREQVEQAEEAQPMYAARCLTPFRYSRRSSRQTFSRPRLCTSLAPLQSSYVDPSGKDRYRWKTPVSRLLSPHGVDRLRKDARRRRYV